MKIAYLPPLLAALAVLVLLSGGPGYRMDFWDLGFGLRGALLSGLFAGAAAAGLAVALLLVKRQRSTHAGKLWAAVAIGLVPAALFAWLLNTAGNHPIHDVTTNPDDPPAFVEILPLRAEAPNPPAYGGPDVAAIQREIYPDLAPLRRDADRRVLFAAALAAARAMGWDIVAADTPAGRIEAVDTTFWYGFNDDIVVVVNGDGGSLRLDVRSKSRVGRSDLGKNAERIRAYLDAVRERLAGA